MTRIVVRLILITIESGTVATAISAASLAYYLSNPSSSNLIVIVSTFSQRTDRADCICFTLQATFMARVYFMGMMFTLNMRGNGGQVMRDGSTVNRTPISFGASNSVQLSDIKSHSSYYQHNVIHVRQNVATQVDKVGHRGCGVNFAPREGYSRFLRCPQHMDGSEVLRSDSEEAKTLECRRKVDEGV